MPPHAQNLFQNSLPHLTLLAPSVLRDHVESAAVQRPVYGSGVDNSRTTICPRYSAESRWGSSCQPVRKPHRPPVRAHRRGRGRPRGPEVRGRDLQFRLRGWATGGSGGGGGRRAAGHPAGDDFGRFFQPSMTLACDGVGVLAEEYQAPPAAAPLLTVPYVQRQRIELSMHVAPSFAQHGFFHPLPGSQLSQTPAEH